MKLIATIFATIALLLGGATVVAAPASATEVCDPNRPGGCPEPPCEDDGRPGGCEPAPEPCDITRPGACEGQATTESCVTERTANDYRAEVVALTAEVSRVTAKADRLQRVADKRAATIQRLRAKIRSLR